MERGANAGNNPPWSEAVSIPYGSMADKLPAAIPRGHGPMCSSSPMTWSASGCGRGLLRKVDDLIHVQGDALPAGAGQRRSADQGGARRACPLSLKSLALFLPAPIWSPGRRAPRGALPWGSACAPGAGQPPPYGLAYRGR